MTLSVVATSESSVTGLSASLREHYGWERFDIRRRLEGGYANDIYLAETDDGEVVVRIVRRPVDIAGLDWEHQLLRMLARTVPEVPAPLAAQDGSTFLLNGEDAVVLLPFVDGKPAEPWFDRLAAAAALAHVHRAAADIQMSERPGLIPLAGLREGVRSGKYFEAIGPTARPLPPELASRQAELDDAQDWLLGQVDRLADLGLRTAPVHGDVFRGNFLVRDGAVVAIVDWEEAKLDWVAYDLANAMWEFCKSGDVVLNRVAADEFVRAYRDAGGTVPPEEDEALIPLVRVRRVLELLRAPYDRTVDWNYQLCNLEAFHGLG